MTDSRRLWWSGPHGVHLVLSRLTPRHFWAPSCHAVRRGGVVSRTLVFPRVTPSDGITRAGQGPTLKISFSSFEMELRNLHST